MLRLDWNMVISIVNLIILYLLMKKFLIGPVTAIMEQRKTQVEQQLENADNSRSQAMELKSQYEGKLNASDQEAEQIILKARTDANAECDQIIGTAKDKAVKIIEEAKRTAAMEQEKALREARAQIAVLAMVAASKIVSAGSDAAGNQLLYDQFLAKAGATDETSLN